MKLNLLKCYFGVSWRQFLGCIVCRMEAPFGLQVKEAMNLAFQATSNEVEYEALVMGLELVKKER